MPGIVPLELGRKIEGHACLSAQLAEERIGIRRLGIVVLRHVVDDGGRSADQVVGNVVGRLAPLRIAELPRAGRACDVCPLRLRRLEHGDVEVVRHLMLAVVVRISELTDIVALGGQVAHHEVRRPVLVILGHSRPNKVRQRVLRRTDRGFVYPLVATVCTGEDFGRRHIVTCAIG